MRMLFILLLPILLVIGCSSNFSDDNQNADVNHHSSNVNANNDMNEKTNEEQEKVAAASTNKNDDTDKEISSESADKRDKKERTNKERYTQMLDELDEELEPLEEKSSDGTRAEMEESGDELYERWDVALNEVYGALERELSDGDMEALRVEQRKWIKKRDAYAEKEAKEFKGGSLYTYALIEAKKEFTKERCYELVEDYME